MAEGVFLIGLEQLAAGLSGVGPEFRGALKNELLGAAEPVRLDAESLAREKIPRIGIQWSRMRVGVTRAVDLVYVAPVKRGVKVRGPDPRRRPNLAQLLLDRAMEPALERNLPAIERRLEGLLDRVVDNFNRG